MARYNAKENKYKSDMINGMSSDYFKTRKNFYNNFYLLVTSNSNLGYSDLINRLESKFGIKLSKEELIDKLKEMKNTYSADKAEEVCIIINLAINRDKGKKEKIMLYETKLKMINEKKVSVKKGESRRKVEHYNGNYGNKDKHDTNFEEANELMDKVINNEEYNKEELSKKLQFIKRYLKEFDQEKYIDFVIKYSKIETISIEELKQLLEVVRFFKTNIGKHISEFNEVDSEDDEKIKELSKLDVIGSKDLDSSMINYPKKLFTWKKNKLEKEFILYNKYEKMLESIINAEIINLKDYYNAADKKIMFEENNLILDYYNNIRRYFDADSSYISGVKTINQADYDKLVKTYKNRIIKDKEIN